MKPKRLVSWKLIGNASWI